MRTAIAPDRTVWRIRRRWLPRHASRAMRWVDRKRASKERDGPSSWWDLPLFDLQVGFWLLVVAALVLLGVPLLLAVFDVAVVALLFVGGVVARVLLRRPWTVEAESEGRTVTRQVVGWRRAGDMVEQLAAEATHGQLR